MVGWMIVAVCICTLSWCWCALVCALYCCTRRRGGDGCICVCARYSHCQQHSVCVHKQLIAEHLHTHTHRILAYTGSNAYINVTAQVHSVYGVWVVCAVFFSIYVPATTNQKQIRENTDIFERPYYQPTRYAHTDAYVHRQTTTTTTTTSTTATKE